MKHRIKVPPPRFHHQKKLFALSCVKKYGQIVTYDDLQKYISKPVVIFEKYYSPSLTTEINSLNMNKNVGGGSSLTFQNILDNSVKEFPSTGSDEVHKINDIPDDSSESQFLQSLREIIRQKVQTSLASKILNFWPPIIPECDSDLKDFLYLIIRIIHDSPDHMKSLHWFSRNMFHDTWHGAISEKNSILKALCVCKVKKDTFWAELNSDNYFKLYMIKNDQLQVNATGTVGSIKISNETITINSPKGKTIKKIVPSDPEQIQFWTEVKNEFDQGKTDYAFPLTFTSYVQPIPASVFPALYEALIADDMHLVNSIIFYKVAKIDNGPQLVESLFDIFAYAGKVNQFLITLVTSEFGKSAVTRDQILRGNSHLTNLFKVYYKRYGIQYYNSFFKNIIKYIDDNYQINLTKLDTCDINACKKVIFKVIDDIVHSSSNIPIEMRHLASILRACAIHKFNSKQAAFNTLNGFFWLRFLSSMLANPSSVDPSIKIEHLDALVAISKILTRIFNLQQFDGNYERFNVLNPEMNKTIFPQLINFILSTADFEALLDGDVSYTTEEPTTDQGVQPPPFYKRPTKEILKEELNFILQTISNASKEFKTKYNELRNQTKSTYPLIGWPVGIFFQQFFEEDVK